MIVQRSGKKKRSTLRCLAFGTTKTVGDGGGGGDISAERLKGIEREIGRTTMLEFPCEEGDIKLVDRGAVPDSERPNGSENGFN